MLGQYGLEPRASDFTVVILDNSLCRDFGWVVWALANAMLSAGS